MTANQPLALQRIVNNLSVVETIQPGDHWILAPEIQSTVEHLFLCFIHGQEAPATLTASMFYSIHFWKENKQVLCSYSEVTGSIAATEKVWQWWRVGFELNGRDQNRWWSQQAGQKSR